MSSELLVHPFEPLYDENSEVLILGSFPSVVSRQQNFYYANSHNRFWPLMGMLFEEEITDREEFCHRHHIALWDVIYSCRIKGSSDSSIADVTVNDIAGLAEKTRIRAVFTTGAAASKLYQKYVDCSLPHYGLPSTSPANAAMRISDLYVKYRVIREGLDE